MPSNETEALRDEWPGKMTRSDAIKLLDRITDNDDPYWEQRVENFWDEKTNTIPTIYHLFAALGVSKEEYSALYPDANFNWPAALTPPASELRERVIDLIDDYTTGSFDPRGVNLDKSGDLADAILALLPAGSGWRPEVRAFADLMESGLRERDEITSKNSWKRCNPKDLREGMEVYIRQMDEHARMGVPKKQCGLDTAEVAIFAMMIADVCGALPAAPSSQEAG